MVIGEVQGSIRKWQRCNFDLPYEHDVSSSFPYIVNINAKGYRSLIYRLDHLIFYEHK